MQVVSVSPAANSQGCPLGQTVSVSFDTTVDQTTVDAGSFVVTQETLLSVDQLLTKDTLSATTVVDGMISFAVANEKTTITFTPRSPLAQNAKFDVLLSTSIKSVDNHALGSIYKWSFQTGSGSVIAPPASGNVSDPAQVPYRSTPVTPLGISYDPYLKPVGAYPINGATNQTLDLCGTITITFNKPVQTSGYAPLTDPAEEPDPDYIQDTSWYTLVSEPVDGFYSPSDTPFAGGHAGATYGEFTGKLTSTFQFVNDTTLLITIDTDSSPLFQNNTVSLTIPAMTAKDGGGLQGPLQYFFTTQYDPLYCSSKLIRIRIGSFIQDVADDTVNFAIFDASNMADQFTPILPSNMNARMMQWLLYCKEEYVRATACIFLLQNSPVIQFKQKGKLLGDIQVTWQQSKIMEDMVNTLNKEALEWQELIQNAGIMPQKVQMAVKGATDWDRPLIGRDFSSYPTGPPAANEKVMPLYSRRGIRVFRPRFVPGWGLAFKW